MRLVGQPAQSSVAETVDNMSGPLSILVLNYPAAEASVYEGCSVARTNRSCMSEPVAVANL